MPQFTINIPDDKVEMVGRAFGVIQGQDDQNETAAQAWTRLKERILWELKREVISLRKREMAEQQIATDADNAITLT